ncbi:hypothetical protein PRIPAC_86318, partial [Pristionchus pacificus]|uniref:Uncharacterized protein n=1 Tax=Pristionchus pacificus TaxID=54126 RepID=A0A2A6BL18_PRIPA
FQPPYINEGIHHTDITTFIQNNCPNLSFVIVDGIVKCKYRNHCLPSIKDKSQTFGLFVTTDSSDQSGTHWLATLFPPFGTQVWLAAADRCCNSAENIFWH